MAGDQTLPGIAGVILAGGASSRFGSNKALADCQGEPMIARVAAVLADLFAERLLVTNTPETYRFLGWPMVGDFHQGAGPLAGIQAALATVKAERAMVVACDMPHLSAPLIRFLCRQGPEWDVVLPRLASGREPLHALYHKRCLPVIERHLNEGQRKIWRLFADLSVREVAEPELLGVVPDLSAFHNVNRPEDLAPPVPTAALTLPAAQALLRRQLRPTAATEVPLAEALGRIPVAPIRAHLAVPACNQSTRDGFAVRSRDLGHASAASPATLTIQGEIAAGDTTSHRLGRGETVRIMTGAPLPSGADAVVPFEEVQETDGAIRLNRPLPRHANLRLAGADCRAGQVLLKAGQAIAPYDLARLAPAGVEHLAVHASPRVGYLCTGSELAENRATLRPGQVVSGNRPLLQALIRQGGGAPVDLGTVPDTVEALAAALTNAKARGLHLCLTTGGMGPGKYDLVQRTLLRLGARILYHHLKVRPGKATLAALLDGLLYIALPGPPPAVHLLFHELVAPLLRAMQGERQPLPRRVEATLAEAVRVRQSGMLHLKEAVVTSAGASLSARLPRPGERPNAILLVPASRKELAAGDRVALHFLPA